MTRRQWNLSVENPVHGLVRDNLAAAVGVGVAGAVAGLVEAFLVVLIVALASTVAGDAVNVESVSFGPLSLAGIDLGTSFLLGGIGLVVFIATQALAAWLEAKASAAQLVEARSRLVDAYVDTDWPAKADLGEGELVAYAGQFVQMAFQSLSQAMNLIGAAMSFVALLASAIVVSPLGALVVLGVGGAFTLVMRPLTNLTRRYASLQGDETKEFVAQLSRLVSVSREMTTFDVGDVLAGQVRGKAAQVAAWARQNRFVLRMVPPIYRTAVLAVVLLGLGLVVRFDLSDIGSLAAIVLILLRAMNYTQTVQARLQSLAETEPYLADLAGRIRDFDERRMERGGAGLERLEHIEFDGVSFSYSEGTPVLENLSLRLARGQMLAVVGPSGAGKSTFVDLLLRLRTPTAGRVLVNGVDARNLAAGAWYARVGFVPQETKLVLGSIADNVVFHRSDVSTDRVRTALVQAQLRELVGRRGLDDSIGERGSLLSGGQRQRVGIARALVGEPDLLILDEPTSALDLDAEHRIVDTLQQLGSDRITVMISHRPAVLRVCDVILVLHRDRPHELHAAASIEDPEQFLRAVVGEVMDEDH